MSSFMWSTHAMKASRSSLGNSGSRTRWTATPWRSSTASSRPPPRVTTCTSCPSRTSCSDNLRTCRARPPSTIGGYSHERVRIRTVWHPSAMSLRPARAADAPAITRVFQAAREHSLAFLPKLHTDAEDHAFFAEGRRARRRHGRRGRRRVVAFLALDGDEVDHLYVDPGHHRQGLGSRAAARTRRRTSDAARAVGLPAQSERDRVLRGARLRDRREHRRRRQRRARARPPDGMVPTMT